MAYIFDHINTMDEIISKVTRRDQVKMYHLSWEHREPMKVEFELHIAIIAETGHLDQIGRLNFYFLLNRHVSSFKLARDNRTLFIY